MKVSIKDGSDVGMVASALEKINDDTRFNLKVEVTGKTVIQLRSIRLKESKVYCGSHPFACDINGGRRAVYLEGADWVEFNDRVNDVLDNLEVAAKVKSAVCIIRKGRNRRLAYNGHWLVGWQREGLRNVKVFSEDPLGPNPHPEWKMDEPDDNYEDWCGHYAPNSWFPEGTPGEYIREEEAVNAR